MPVYVHVIDHRDARVLVHAGITELHPAAADLDQNVRETRTSRFEVRSGEPKFTFNRGEPHNLVASLFTLRPRLEDE